jgi:hypothetical protein
MADLLLPPAQVLLAVLCCAVRLLTPPLVSARVL